MQKVIKFKSIAAMALVLASGSAGATVNWNDALPNPNDYSLGPVVDEIDRWNNWLNDNCPDCTDEMVWLWEGVEIGDVVNLGYPWWFKGEYVDGEWHDGAWQCYFPLDLRIITPAPGVLGPLSEDLGLGDTPATGTQRGLELQTVTIESDDEGGEELGDCVTFVADKWGPRLDATTPLRTEVPVCHDPNVNCNLDSVAVEAAATKSTFFGGEEEPVFHHQTWARQGHQMDYQYQVNWNSAFPEGQTKITNYP